MKRKFLFFLLTLTLFFQSKGSERFFSRNSNVILLSGLLGLITSTKFFTEFLSKKLQPIDEKTINENKKIIVKILDGSSNFALSYQDHSLNKTENSTFLPFFDKKVGINDSKKEYGTQLAFFPLNLNEVGKDESNCSVVTPLIFLPNADYSILYACSVEKEDLQGYTLTSTNITLQRRNNGEENEKNCWQGFPGTGEKIYGERGGFLPSLRQTTGDKFFIDGAGKLKNTRYLGKEIEEENPYCYIPVFLNKNRPIETFNLDGINANHLIENGYFFAAVSKDPSSPKVFFQCQPDAIRFSLLNSQRKNNEEMIGRMNEKG